MDRIAIILMMSSTLKARVKGRQKVAKRDAFCAELRWSQTITDCEKSSHSKTCISDIKILTSEGTTHKCSEHTKESVYVFVCALCTS